MRKKIGVWAIAGLASLLWALPGGGGAGTAEGETLRVTIVDFAFDPAKLTVKVGDTVEFINQDGYPHTATREAKDGFDTAALNTGQSMKITFKKTGVFHYGCSIHPSMEGTIEVKE
ncbi:MAG: plastocyanin/azurin family copper-binding protein [bacterium]